MTAMTHSSPQGLDAIDRRIVAELSADARLSVRSLAERIHVSRTAAHARVQNLVARGVITGFGARIDRRAIGLGVSALIVVKIGDVPWTDMAEKLLALPFEIGRAHV